MIHRKCKTMTGESGASFSDCERFRFSLWRVWDTGPLLNWIMLNPSTADHETNDPTIERCERRADKLGYGGIIVTNLFAFRATNPDDMRRQADPVGVGNDDAIKESASQCKLVICAWGNHGKHMQRYVQVRGLLAAFCPDKLHHLGLTKASQPQHPLYVPYETQPIPWSH